MPHVTFRAASALSAALVVAATLLAAPAAAHVRVDEGQAPPRGGYGVVRLLVPTESADASTVGLTVTLPDGVDLTTARTLPVPGWRATVETETAGDAVRVTRIAWRAVDEASGVKPSEFGEFTFSAGPWPQQSDTVALPSDQSYSDGSVVSWNEIAVDQASEPEHPAPVVALGAAEGGHSHDGHGGHGADTAEVVAASADSPAGESWLWRTASLISLVVALGTAGLLAWSLRRNRGAGPS